MTVWYRYIWFSIDSVTSSFKHGIELSGTIKKQSFLANITTTVSEESFHC